MKRTSRIQLQQQHHKNMAKKLLSSHVDTSLHPTISESIVEDAEDAEDAELGTSDIDHGMLHSSGMDTGSIDPPHDESLSLSHKPGSFTHSLSDNKKKGVGAGDEENVSQTKSTSLDRPSSLSDGKAGETGESGTIDNNATMVAVNTIADVATTHVDLQTTDIQMNDMEQSSCIQPPIFEDVESVAGLTDTATFVDRAEGRSSPQLSKLVDQANDAHPTLPQEILSTADTTLTSVPLVAAIHKNKTIRHRATARVGKHHTKQISIDMALDDYSRDNSEADNEQDIASDIDDASDTSQDEVDPLLYPVEPLIEISNGLADSKVLPNNMVEVDQSDSSFSGHDTFSTHPDIPRSVQWIKGPLIGAGSFGKVFYGVNCVSGEIMAVKQVQVRTSITRSRTRRSEDSGSSEQQQPTQDDAAAKARRKMLEALHREISLLKDLDHDNIVRYLGFDVEQDFISVFLEYVSGGSVSTALAVMGNFEEPLIRSIIQQVLNGLQYLHERLIIHRDIKGGNILIDEDGWAKISDFGISKKNKHQMAYRYNSRMSIQGSVYWMAPEVVKSKGYSAKVDIWSLGCVMLEMFTGSHPWRKLDEVQTMWRLGREDKPPLPEYLSPMGTDFLSKSFTINPEERPTAAELGMHPFCVFDPTTFDFRAYKEEAIRRKQLMDLSSSGSSMDEDYLEEFEEEYEDENENQDEDDGADTECRDHLDESKDMEGLEDDHSQLVPTNMESDDVLPSPVHPDTIITCDNMDTAVPLITFDELPSQPIDTGMDIVSPLSSPRLAPSLSHTPPAVPDVGIELSEYSVPGLEDGYVVVDDRSRDKPADIQGPLTPASARPQQ
ncbi:hypothetical protein BASA83_005561 [Batrachochytrium salamandrivorans]|nr:hypothetical protein BASA83_005561 [Batrachochytrium salamandrivorans]